MSSPADSPQANRYIGLMSGTSMDGIDAAIVDFSATQPQLVTCRSHSYPETIQQQLDHVLSLGDPRQQDLSALDLAIGDAFGQAAAEVLASARLAPADIRAIGSHGQTVFHAPDDTEPCSIQLGNPDTICALTGIDTVADFRRADIEAGGQGAPLAPAFHNAVLRSSSENRVVINIGGIGNITVLPADPARPVIGFDTGPGNTLMDIWIRRHTGNRYDDDGDWAASGKRDLRILAALLADPYFRMPPPKSTGREYFNSNWLSSFLQGVDTNPAHIQATLCELTAVSIADAIELHAADTARVLICGGGVHNSFLMERLQEHLGNIPVESTAGYGIDPDWMEAMAFAWLAKQFIEGKPGNIPAVTGAARPVILGKLVRHNADS